MPKAASLSSNVVASAANVVVVVGSALVAVPLLINGLGIEGYGFWILAQTLIIYVTTAQLGVGPAIARFMSVHSDEPERLRSIASLAIVLYVIAGLIVVGLCHLLAAPLVDLFDVPPPLAEDVEAAVRFIGWVALVALLAGVLGHMLEGLERFAAHTWTNLVGSIVFLAALIVLMEDDPRVQDAAVATGLQWTAVLLARVGVLRAVLLGPGPRRPGPMLLRDIAGFSARLQLGVVAALVNTQTDRVIIGLVASPVTLGNASIATQVADAGRMLAYSAFHPLASRMAVVYGRDGQPQLDELLARQRRLWTVVLLGGIAVAVGAVWPGIEAWLGEGYDEAALFAALLLAAYGVSLLPGPIFAYLRATGRPTLEGVYGLVTVIVNIVATIAMAILFGAVGVIAATLAAYLASTAWVLRQARGQVPEDATLGRGGARIAVALVVAGGATYAIGTALLELLPRYVALAGLIAAATASFVGYVAVTTDLRPAALARRRGAGAAMSWSRAGDG